MASNKVMLEKLPYGVKQDRDPMPGESCPPMGLPACYVSGPVIQPWQKQRMGGGLGKPRPAMKSHPR